MMYYLSGLQQIDSALYESAAIDGAGTLDTFRYITIPLLKPTTIYVLTISIFGGMAMFSESYSPPRRAPHRLQDRYPRQKVSFFPRFF